MIPSFCAPRIVVSAADGERGRDHAGLLASFGFETRVHVTGAAGRRLHMRRPDADGAAAFMWLAESWRPDLVYDLRGALCVVHAAALSSVPVVCVAEPHDWLLPPSSLMQRLARAAHISTAAWDATREARDYAAFVRRRVSAFIVGDADAQAQFISAGVPESRIAIASRDDGAIAHCARELFAAMGREPGRAVYADAAD